MEVPQLVNTGFQGLFHSPPGVLFTVPSQYSALSVTEEYLALRGGPPAFRQGFSCLVVLWSPLAASRISPTGLSPSPAGFPKTVLLPFLHAVCGPNPGDKSPVWALSFSLAATQEIDVSFSS